LEYPFDNIIINNYLGDVWMKVKVRFTAKDGGLCVKLILPETLERLKEKYSDLEVLDDE